MCVCVHVCIGHVCIGQSYEGMCARRTHHMYATDMSIGVCASVGMDMCRGMYADMGADIGMDVCVAMCRDMF